MAKHTFEADWFFKYPNDDFVISYDFTNDLGGDTLSELTVASIINEDGVDQSTTMVSATSVTTPLGYITVQAGTAGETYYVRVQGTSNNSAVYTHNLTLEVYGAVTLNTKLGDSSQNSYVSVKEANDYIRSKYGHDSIWDTLDLEGKKRVLIESANDLEQFNYNGDKYYSVQGLQFPRDDHEVLTGDCATPYTTTSFKGANLYSTTYNKYPANYWKTGAVHIKAGLNARDVRVIATSNVTTGNIIVKEAFSNTVAASDDYVIFAPLHKEVKDAQCEQTLFNVKNSNVETLSDYQELGAKSVRIGDVGVEFKDSSNSRTPISGPARKLISRWIRKSIRLQRA